MFVSTWHSSCRPRALIIDTRSHDVGGKYVNLNILWCCRKLHVTEKTNKRILTAKAYSSILPSVVHTGGVNVAVM